MVVVVVVAVQQKLNSPQFQSSVAPNVKLNSLIKHDHDTTVGKHSWVNGVFNGTEINENNLKLYRAELKRITFISLQGTNKFECQEVSITRTSYTQRT